MYITDDIRYVGVNDHKIDLFEGQYVVPDGMAYNSYVILDYKVAVMDTVDRNFTHEWLDKLAKVLGDRKPDYLVVHHMEPDHSANILNFMKLYPEAQIVSSAAAFRVMNNYFGTDFADRRLVVGEGDTLPLGRHVLQFITAPMVHWPEVIMSYEKTDKVLFSADGFGKFGALDAYDDDWACEARRYYFGIVGKFGDKVQDLLKKAAGMDIKTICPLHGPILKENLGYYLDLYNTWSSYEAETEGVAIFYTSVYGHTKEAAEKLVPLLKAEGCPEVALTDLARDDMAEAVEDAFRYSKIVLATTTYNGGIFPFMQTFIEELKERNYQKRTIGLIENGSWAPQAAKVMKNMLEGGKDLTFAENTVKILGALNDTSNAALKALAQELCAEYEKPGAEELAKQDPKAMFKIGYGLYVVTTNDGKKDNGCIVNTVVQLTSTPNRVAVCINKQNYTHHIVEQTGILNLNVLSVEAPFSVFQEYGFVSGRAVDKFAGKTLQRSGNGLLYLDKYINAYLSLKVEEHTDMGTHGLFICSVTESKVVSSAETMTYSYYQSNVKPRPPKAGETKKKGWVCTVCGYIYEGEELPADFICPLCKHGAADFERLQ
ncbi:MAG: flavin reductase [Lachnospiraceae bacterium]|nr:flavin reductase [Lachnospiraceae bacterium]